jgi:hypothetical protein
VHAGADLDLRFQELARHLIPQAPAAPLEQACGISRTRSRLVRSTSRYSSSMPMVNDGVLEGHAGMVA